MCLHWCHQRRLIYDSSFPCWSCESGDWQAQPPPEQTCPTCVHLVLRDEQPALCGLTRAPLPHSQTCCQWNAPRTDAATLHIDATALLPGLCAAYGVDDVAGVFTDAPGAPPWTADAAGVVVARADLAVPLVYGVVDSQWETLVDAAYGGHV